MRSDKHTAWASLAPVGALAQKHRLADLLPRQVGHHARLVIHTLARNQGQQCGRQNICKSADAAHAAVADVGDAPHEQGNDKATQNADNKEKRERRHMNVYGIGAAPSRKWTW